MKVSSAGIIVMLVLTSCSAAYPEETFFNEVKNQQRSLAEGQISFVPNPSWQSWAASQASNIEGWSVLSPSGRCQGVTSANPISYLILKEGSGYIVQMGSNSEIVCRFGEAKSATFLLFPIINPRPLFDPDELVGGYEFQIHFVPIIK